MEKEVIYPTIIEGYACAARQRQNSIVEMFGSKTPRHLHELLTLIGHLILFSTHHGNIFQSHLFSLISHCHLNVSKNMIFSDLVIHELTIHILKVPGQTLLLVG